MTLRKLREIIDAKWQAANKWDSDSYDDGYCDGLEVALDEIDKAIADPQEPSVVTEDDITFLLQRGALVVANIETEAQSRKHTRTQVESIIDRCRPKAESAKDARELSIRLIKECSGSEHYSEKLWVFDRYRPEIGKMAEGAETYAATEEEARIKVAARYTDPEDAGTWFELASRQSASEPSGHPLDALARAQGIDGPQDLSRIVGSMPDMPDMPEPEAITESASEFGYTVTESAKTCAKCKYDELGTCKAGYGENCFEDGYSHFKSNKEGGR